MAKPYLIFKAHTGFYYAQIRLADGPLSFQHLPKKNIDVLEEISKWDEQLAPIVDMFVSAFAKSNKAMKDGYDSQIKDYDHQLNGYTKETAYGKKQFFGLLR